MQLAFARYGDRLLCALKVFDNGPDGGILWSVVERNEELNGIRGLARGEPLAIFLFNEIVINVAWRILSGRDVSKCLLAWIDNVTLGPVDHSSIETAIFHSLESLHRIAEDDEDWLVFEVGDRIDWQPVRNHFITASASASLIDIFDANEGNQQEQIGIWLTDNLQPSGVYHSPKILRGDRTRELTDLLLSHEFGAVVIESKTLSVLARRHIPDRAKLTRDISGHIRKAFDQLRGALKALRSGAPVTDSKGKPLIIERQKPAHAIVVIPDLDLIDDRGVYDVAFMRDFMEATGGFAHLVDISELLRIVQAAEMIAARGTTTTLMMAFDYYLMRRAEKAVGAGTLCIEVLLRFSDSPETAK